MPAEFPLIPEWTALSQEGLHYGDVHYMPVQYMLKMQCMLYHYFVNLVWENNFQLAGVTMNEASNTTTILRVFVSMSTLGWWSASLAATFMSQSPFPSLSSSLRKI